MASKLALPASALPGAKVCGGLGRVDRSRVRDMAAVLGSELATVYESRHGYVLCGHPIQQWHDGTRHGFAWAGAGPRGTGLRLDGRRPVVYSSPSALPTVFWADGHNATYFASRIEPLAETHPDALHGDWEAWAAIMRFGSVLGSRTPFEEVRRLEPDATLSRGRSGGVAAASRWSWAEVEQTSLDDSAEALAEALRTELSPLRASSVVVPLSGGADSRGLAAALARDRPRELRAVTIAGTSGDDVRLAPPAAEALGIGHTTLRVDERSYWDDFVSVAARSEYAHSLEWAWLVPLGRAIESTADFAVDGLAGETMVRGKYPGPQSGDPEEMFRAMTEDPIVRGRRPRRMFAAKRAAMIEASAWDQLRAVARPYESHPMSMTLTFARARSINGVSAGPSAAIGHAVPTLVPYLSDPVARAALRCPPQDKSGGALFKRLFEMIAPQLNGVPTSSWDHRPSPRTLFGERREEAVLTRQLQLLAESPLRPRFRGRLSQAIDTGDVNELGRVGGGGRGLNGLLMLGLWLRRYGARLADPTPGAPF